MDTARRLWEGDSVQLATKEVSLTLIPWTRTAGRIPGQRSGWRVNLTAGVVSVTEIYRHLPFRGSGKSTAFIDLPLHSAQGCNYLQ